MFFDDKHKAVTTIMSKRGPKGGAHTSDPTPMMAEKVMNEGGEVDGRHLAAQDILAAHRSESPMKLMEAMKNFIDLHLNDSSRNEGPEQGT